MSRRHYKSVSGGGVLPAGYAECEYIECTGTQYISLNYRSSTSMTFNITIEANSTSATQGLFQAGKDGARQMIIITAAGRYDYVMGSGYKSLNVQQEDIAPNVVLDITVTYSSVVINEHSYSIIGLPNIVSNFQNTNLFALNFTDQNPINANNFFAGKCRGFSIENEGQNVVELIPALRLSDNKPGMYDLCGSICPLTGTPFYVNAGSGEFLYQLKN